MVLNISQLVRMVLFTAEDATVDQKCAIARELLDGFSRVPVLFLRALSSPLVSLPIAQTPGNTDHA
jgi:hypothetical protein